MLRKGSTKERETEKEMSIFCSSASLSPQRRKQQHVLLTFLYVRLELKIWVEGLVFNLQKNHHNV